MIHKIKYVVLALIVAVSSSSYAQMRPYLGVGVDVGIPTGDLEVTQSTGIGGTAKLGIPIGGTTFITVTSGYMSFSGKEYRNISGNTVKYPAYNFIPIKAGVRYRIIPAGLYLEPQLGYTVVNSSNSAITTHGGFTYAAGLGYAINNMIDLSARYEGISQPNDRSFDFIGIRAAYNIKL